MLLSLRFLFRILLVHLALFLSFFFRITRSLPGAHATPRANLPKSERRPGFCKNTLSSLQTQKGTTAALEQLAALGAGGDEAT